MSERKLNFNMKAIASAARPRVGEPVRRVIDGIWIYALVSVALVLAAVYLYVTAR